MSDLNVSEQDYINGQRQVWRELLGQCLRALGYDPSEDEPGWWIQEREDAITALRALSVDYGDGEWDDDLYLADNIESHITNHLPEIEE